MKEKGKIVKRANLTSQFNKASFSLLGVEEDAVLVNRMVAVSKEDVEERRGSKNAFKAGLTKS